jgi:hypothetical protein
MSDQGTHFINNVCYSTSRRLENSDPTTNKSATNWESYTQCHLDAGPTLGRQLRSLLGGDPEDPRGKYNDEGKFKENSP